MYLALVRSTLMYPSVVIHMNSKIKLRKLQSPKKNPLCTDHKTRRDRKRQSYLHQTIHLEPVNKVLNKQAKSTWNKIEAILTDHNYDLSIHENIETHKKKKQISQW